MTTGIKTRPIGQSEHSQSTRLSLWMGIVIVALLLPIDFDIGTVILSPYKIVYLGLVPVLTIALLTGRFGRLVWTDAFVFLFIFWITLSIGVNNPLSAVQFVGSQAVIMLGGYLAGRAFVQTKADYKNFILFLAVIVLLSIPFALHETLTSRPIVLEQFSRIPGTTTHEDVNHDLRAGLWRVQWVFPHPIHYGLFCSLVVSPILIGMTLTTGARKRWLLGIGVVICCFLSLSSGPFLAMIFQFGLIGWYFVTRNIERRWTIFMVLVAIVYLIIEIASDRPGIYAVVSRLSFNQQNALVRIILLDYGFDQIWRTPVLGVGYNRWELPSWMTGSLDNFWLMVALIYGVPAFLFFLGGILYSSIKVGLRDFTGDRELEYFRLGWMFSLVGLSLTLATVAVWGQLFSIVFLFLGAGVWMINCPVEAANQEEIPPPPEVPNSRYTRFPDARPKNNLPA